MFNGNQQGRKLPLKLNYTLRDKTWPVHGVQRSAYTKYFSDNTSYELI
jgi:hypothetical protein